MHFFQEAVYQKKLPEVFAAVEKMPASQQETMTGKLAEVVLRSTIGDVEQDAKFVDSLQHVPASLREVARSAIQQSTSGSPERKEAALKALK